MLPVGLIAQLVDHCTGIVEVMGSNPVQACGIFFRLSFRNCFSCVKNCDDHSLVHMRQCCLSDLTDYEEYQDFTVNDFAALLEL